MTSINTPTQRDELAREIWLADRNRAAAAWGQPSPDDYVITDRLIAAGYRKPVVLGYLVVDSAGNPVGEDSYEDRAGAQGDADAWNDETFGPVPDGGYRVAEIVEATR